MQAMLSLVGFVCKLMLILTRTASAEGNGQGWVCDSPARLCTLLPILHILRSLQLRPASASCTGQLV